MKKWFSKILCGIMLLLMAFAFSGCKENKYNAILYSDCNEWFTAEFLENNKVYGAYYENPDYIEGESDINERGYYDNVSPKQRTICVTEETFDMVFLPNKLQVDFSKQMIWVYVFTDCNGCREYFIDEIVKEGSKLTIYYILEKKEGCGHIADATMPFQRCFILIMDKVGVDGVGFVRQRQKNTFGCDNGCYD